MTVPAPLDPTVPVRWGILGTGGIARSFAEDLVNVPDAVVGAVGSRTAGRAQEFAAGLSRRDGTEEPVAHGSYADLVADPDVDVIYVATPHPAHREDTLAALGAGKAVLCEKPFAVDAGSAREMVAAARASGVFLMEAMWTRFLPHMTYLKELVSSGGLGEVVTVTAEHGQGFVEDASHRLFAPELGGGALLDLGIYPVSFACWMLGTPVSVTAVSDAAFTGVDGQTSAVLRFAGGAHAVVTTTLRAQTVNAAGVSGTSGRVVVEPTFYAPSALVETIGAGEPVRREFATVGHGLHYEAAEVGRCLRAGLTESAVMPWDDTLAVMDVMDEIRDQIGLRYPWETASTG